MIGAIITAIIMILIGTVMVMVADDGDGALKFAGTVLLIIGGAIIGVCAALDDDAPSAMDVYRNKTTLEITYRDSIPIDSIVVFKK